MGVFSVYVKTKNNKLKMDAFRVGPVDMKNTLRVGPEKAKGFCCFSRCFQVMNIKKLQIPVWCQKAIFLLSTKLLSCSLFTLPKLQIL
jgi:hypothetical protein